MRDKDDEGGHRRLAGVRRGQLAHLAEARYGATLPDNADGRLLLKARLACGLTGPAAHRWAPWIAPDELEGMITEIDAVPPTHWTADRLGRMVELTDTERETHGIFSLRPCDVPWHVVRERQHDKEKTRDKLAARERRRKAAEARRMAVTNSVDLDLRGEVLFVMIGPRPVNVENLMQGTANHPRFRAPNGRPLTGSSLSRVIRRELDALKSDGRIKDEHRPGKRGAWVRWVWRA